MAGGLHRLVHVGSASQRIVSHRHVVGRTLALIALAGIGLHPLPPYPHPILERFRRRIMGFLASLVIIFTPPEETQSLCPYVPISHSGDFPNFGSEGASPQ